MSVIVVDGPEKAGKSTMIAELVKQLVATHLHRNVFVRRWGPVDPDDRAYSDNLMHDTQMPSSVRVVIWDRSWASEHVYGTLLHRDRRLAQDPWLGEWLHGRAAQANGIRVILKGPPPFVLRELRTPDDLDVDTNAEQRMYVNYGERYGWNILEQTPKHSSPEELANVVLNLFEHRVRSFNMGADFGFMELPLRYAEGVVTHAGRVTPLPPMYCGPINAKVIFIGEQRSDSVIPGGWLPFTSKMTTMLGRLLGDKAFSVGWTNAHDCPPHALRGAKILVACGKIAQQWAQNYVLQKGGDQRVVNIPHPAHAFRYNNDVARNERDVINQSISQLMKEV